MDAKAVPVTPLISGLLCQRDCQIYECLVLFCRIGLAPRVVDMALELDGQEPGREIDPPGVGARVGKWKTRVVACLRD